MKDKSKIRKDRVNQILSKNSSLVKNSELDRWFKEKWVDISKKDKSGKHPPCGRSDADKGKYPKCRPSKRVNKKTPTTSKELSKKEKTKAVKTKRKVEKKKPNKPAGGGARKPKVAPKVRKRRMNKKSSEMPFLQLNISGNEFIRSFNPKDKEDFVWHRDHEDRLIKVLAGEGWFIQFENELPVKLTEGKEISISKNSWHRIIAGSTNLNIIVKESEQKKDRSFFKENLDYDGNYIDKLKIRLKKKVSQQELDNFGFINFDRKDMKNIPTKIYIDRFEDLAQINLDLSEVFLDNPIGSKKGFGSEKKRLPFDYGEFSKFINPSDDMGWDIIVAPSQSTGEVHQERHNYVIVGIVEVNEDERVWKEKAQKKPPYGNHKVIVSNFGKYEDKDVEIIEDFFKNMWQFKKPKFFEV